MPSRCRKSKLFDLDEVRSALEQQSENSRSEKYALECQKLSKQIEQLELKIQAESGLYVESEEVKKTWLKHIAQARNILISIPELAPNLCGKTAAQIETELQTEIDKVIAKLRGGLNEA